MADDAADGRIPAGRAIKQARALVEELAGRTPEGVSGISHGGDGCWTVSVDVPAPTRGGRVVTSALYAYAVVTPDRTPRLGVDGVGPGPLEVVAAGAVAAVTGPVDVEQFEGDALERNLAIPGWLETVVRAHERVVESLLGPEPVLPMRFGSIFSGPDALRDMLGRNASALGGLLEQLRGRVELGVTVRYRRGAAEPVAAGVGSGRAGATSSGAAAPSEPPSGWEYLRRRQAEMNASRRAGDASAALAARLHDALAGAAERAAVLSPRRSDPDLVLSAAYLVPDRSVDGFCVTAEVVGRSHGPELAVEVTGPWPPYSFTSIDVSGPG